MGWAGLGRIALSSRTISGTTGRKSPCPIEKAISLGPKLSPIPLLLVLEFFGCLKKAACRGSEAAPGASSHKWEACLRRYLASVPILLVLRPRPFSGGTSETLAACFLHPSSILLYWSPQHSYLLGAELSRCFNRPTAASRTPGRANRSPALECLPSGTNYSRRSRTAAAISNDRSRAAWSWKCPVTISSSGLICARIGRSWRSTDSAEPTAEYASASSI
jgi:hypothetical protein